MLTTFGEGVVGVGDGDGSSNRSHFDVIPISKNIWSEMIRIEKSSGSRISKSNHVRVET